MDAFLQDIDDYKTWGDRLQPYEWSHELAMSASHYLEELDGCHLVPGQLKDEPQDYDTIKRLAAYKEHR